MVEAAIATMLQSAAAAAASSAHGATACTDVTGFGLLGHLLEMLGASAMDARLDPEAIPALDGALDCSARASPARCTRTIWRRWLRSTTRRDPRSPPLLIDPQTAGGLLAGVPADRAAACLAELRAAGYRAAEIGLVER